MQALETENQRLLIALEAIKRGSTKLEASILKANENTKLIETKEESFSVTVQAEPPPTDETINEEVVSLESPIASLSNVESKVEPSSGSVTSLSVGSGSQKSDVTTLEEIQSQAQELQNKINALPRSELLKEKEEILKQNSKLLEVLSHIEGGDIPLRASIQVLLKDNIQLAIKGSKQRPPPPSRSPTGPVNKKISEILEDVSSSFEKKRLADQAIELYEKNIISPQKKDVSETIQNALESIISNFNFFDSQTINLDLIDDYFDEINPNALEDDLDDEIEDFNTFHQKTLSDVDKIIAKQFIEKVPTERSNLSIKIGALKIKNRFRTYANALFDYISYLFSRSIEKKKFNDFVKYYENKLEERVKSERIQELLEQIQKLKEQTPELKKQFNCIIKTLEKLKNFIDEQKNPGSKSILTLSDDEKIKKLECLDKVLLEKKSDFYAVIETLQSQGINILEINYSDYVKWKELKLGKDNVDLFEFPLRGAGVLEELKYVSELLNDMKKIINDPDQSQGKAQEIYEKIIKGKKITLGQLRYSSLYAPITEKEFNHLLENLQTIISENESPREKLIRLLDKVADTEKLSQVLQSGSTINKRLLDNIHLDIEQFQKIITSFVGDFTKTPTSAELGIDDGLYQIITSSSPSPVSPTEDPILVELEEITRKAQRVQEGISQAKDGILLDKYSKSSKLQQENNRLLSLIKDKKFIGRDISSIQILLESNKAKISELSPPPPPPPGRPSAPASDVTVSIKPPPPPPQGQPSTPVTPPVHTRPFGTPQSLLAQIQNPPPLKNTPQNPPYRSPQRSFIDEIKKPRQLRATEAKSSVPINNLGLFGSRKVNDALQKASQKKSSQAPSSSELEKYATIAMNSEDNHYELILYIDKSNNFYLYNGEQFQINLIGEPFNSDAQVIEACQSFYHENNCSGVSVIFEPTIDVGFNFGEGDTTYFEDEISKTPSAMLGGQ